MKQYAFTVWFQERGSDIAEQVLIEVSNESAVTIANALGPEGARRILARRATQDIQGEKVQQRFHKAIYHPQASK